MMSSTTDENNEKVFLLNKVFDSSANTVSEHATNVAGDDNQRNPGVNSIATEVGLRDLLTEDSVMHNKVSNSSVETAFATCSTIEMGVDEEVEEYEQDGPLKEHEARRNVNLLFETEFLEPVEVAQHAKLEAHLNENAPCEVQVAEDKVQSPPLEPFDDMEQKAESLKSAPETKFKAVNDTGTSATNNQESLNSERELKASSDENQLLDFEEGVRDLEERELSQIDLDLDQDMKVQADVLDTKQAVSEEDQEMEIDEWDTDAESDKQVSCKSESSGKAHQASYQLSFNDGNEFSPSDLVWGKVRSHPWWPGQIFDPSDASEKAVKHHKKDSYLVAYFGDGTFAWNEASQLKPFRSHFSLGVKQSNFEAFRNAIDCALEEVSRRVEMGLACSCIPRETYEMIKFQAVENAGILKEARTRESQDKLSSADDFEPKRFVDYLKELSQSPVCGADQLEFAIASSQLKAFYHSKGLNQLPKFQFCGDIETLDDLSSYVEYNEDADLIRKDTEKISRAERTSYNKRKHNLKDGDYRTKKERSLSELMVDTWDSFGDDIGSDGKVDSKMVSPSSSKKRKGTGNFVDNSPTANGRRPGSRAKVSSLKPSFKIGECIRRAASQMNRSPSILKSNSQKLDEGSDDGIIEDTSEVPLEHSEDAELKEMSVSPTDLSADELLSQLHFAAQDPLKGSVLLNNLVGFFSDFRNSELTDHGEQVGGKEGKLSYIIDDTPETFEFEDMNDTYWTDRATQNGIDEQHGIEEQQPPSRKKKKRDNQIMSTDKEKHKRKSNSKKRSSEAHTDQLPEKPSSYVDENAPSELVMHFPLVDSIPSEVSLNKMFRRFGPLKEYATEIDRDTNRARVVFRRCADAKAAYDSAPKFNIFGSVLVNYQLNYTVSAPFKTVQIVPTQGEEDPALFLQY